MGEHRHADVEQRRAHVLAEQGAVAVVLGVGDERHTRGQQLRARGLDVDRAVARRVREPQPVVGAGELAVLHLGLRDRGLEVDVPLRGRLGRVGVPALEHAEEAVLRGAS